MTSPNRPSNEKTIEDLPDEILEYILSLVSPYKDSDSCRIVSKRWWRTINSVNQHSKCDLYRSVLNCSVLWQQVTIPSVANGGPSTSIAKRFSHAACYCDSSMYVFGGCTARCTTFNDLWTLDLSSREWVRPVSTGCYPSPKACATICNYRKSLILFGGWTHPPPYPLHQMLRLYNELHIYDICSNKWTVVHCSLMPPPMAGHSATIQGDYMVIFGGLQKADALDLYSSSNDVWCFDLESHCWSKPETTDPKPSRRYGHSQIFLDNETLLIIGGCREPNSVVDDIWLLKLTKSTWIWKQVTVVNNHWAAPQIWCHPACRVGNAVVIFSRASNRNLSAYPSGNTSNPAPLPESSIPPEVIARQALQNSCPTPKDCNVNGHRGILSKTNQSSTVQSTSDSSNESLQLPLEPGCSKDLFNDRNQPQPHCSSRISSEIQMAAFRDEDVPGKQVSSKNRMKQLESLRRLEARYKNPPKPEDPKPKKNDDPPDPMLGNLSKKMNMYVADISDVLVSENGSVVWKPPRSNSGAPRDTVLHSLVLGKGELIIFGGVQKSIAGLSFSGPVNYKAVSNTAHFITAPRTIV